MEENPFISICIPAYQRAVVLRRLLDSIEIQHYKDYEIVITDDSRGGEVQDLVSIHPASDRIRYFKNPETLGTPENWNESVRQAKAPWIKIMHDDDWFTSAYSLQKFAEAAQSGASTFYFSAYANLFPNGNKKKVRMTSKQLRILKSFPESLLASNTIGPPSVVLFKKDQMISFDKKMQWLVDIDFYIRYLKKYPKAKYLPDVLINIGISLGQVTQSSFGIPAIEIPERFLLQDKLTWRSLNNILIYDSWWRFVRNMQIDSVQKISSSGYFGEIPEIIENIINVQKKIPGTILNTGGLSKILMSFSFFYKKIKRSLSE